MKKLLFIPLTFGFGFLLFSAGCGTDNSAEVPSGYTESQRSADTPKQLVGAGGAGDGSEDASNVSAASTPPLPEP